MSKINRTPIERAADVVGGVPKLAAACDVSAQAVYKWLRKGYPPVDRCEAVERAAKGEVTRFELLPPSFTAPTKPVRAGRKVLSVSNLK